MKIRKNIGYEIKPEYIEVGERWINVRLRNDTGKEMSSLSVKLNTLDTLGLEIRHGSEYVDRVRPSEEVYLNFRVAVFLSTPVYVSIDGFLEDDLFYWESPAHMIRTDRKAPELVSVFASRNPRILTGDNIRCDATVKSNGVVEDVHLETWIEAPDGVVEELESQPVDDLAPDEIKVYSSEFRPDLEGVYAVHSQLFQGMRRLGHKVDYVMVESAR